MGCSFGIVRVYCACKTHGYGQFSFPETFLKVSPPLTTVYNVDDNDSPSISREARATDQQVEDEMCLLDLEDADSLLLHVQDLVSQHLDEFPEDRLDDEAAGCAAKMAKASITDGTRDGHLRIIKHCITFHLRRNKNWDAKQVDDKTPHDITAFITQKCGPYSTAVSTRAALTMWYKNLRPNESLTEWRLDGVTWYFYAKSGEVSSSARALALEDIHRLHDHCMNPKLTLAQKRAGIVRYVAYLLAWLMLLRIDEVMKLRFENIDKVPGERKFLDVSLNTRKQNQTGVLHSWRLHANDADPVICPMRAFILLASLYGPEIKKSGPLFLHVSAQGATASALSRSLSRDLQSLGYSSWALYGTHSFRRGGCQYRIKVRKWSADQVAAWGGWSQVEAVTMFRYFYSPNDNHEYMHDYDRNY
ncbi:hypothetical protein R3P38DRAFT_3332034 [Favolaschia claudopus]|uniref:Tyr recombinase domain-containing protein n=1 Tax=Favolaschia claudopus TaxID=2862362 RepID=A0AAV9ZQ25_9AGAR